jgi:hypothetical protein
MRLENSSNVMDQAAPRPVPGDGRRSGARLAPTPAVEILRGRPAVAAMRRMLTELCRRTGQPGAMDALELFLGAPSALKKQPHLLLVGLRPGVEPIVATADDVAGAVLIYQYRVAGCATGVFATDDLNGERTVIAPAAIRAEVAQLACRALMENGATAALISFEGSTEATRRPLAEAGVACRIATRLRSVPRYLALAATLDSTLATLGDDTRRNLRRYRRRLERDFGARFVANVEVGRDEFLAMNRASTHPLGEAIAAWQYNVMAEVAGPVFCGVRAADGRWLSLLGGRRRPGLIEVDWQMNLAGFPRYSLSTAMRSFLLEYEISRGTRSLTFLGGTPHSMRHSFACVDAVDVVVQRRSIAAWLLRRLSRWIFPAKNFLGQALRDRSLRWTPWPAGAPPTPRPERGFAAIVDDTPVDSGV